MKYVINIYRKLFFLLKVFILRDSFYQNIYRWNRDNGDKRLRFNYPLNTKSIVFDVGGYIGDYSEEINKKFGCKVYLFEPVPTFFNICSRRFRDNKSIVCLKYGLSSHSNFIDICLDDNASSFKRFNPGHEIQKAELKDICEVFNEFKLKKIDLIKINIEGGEFDLLPAIINSGLINKIEFIQIQFHNFIKDSNNKRDEIRESLKKTHEEIWCYDFVWESWRAKKL